MQHADFDHVQRELDRSKTQVNHGVFHPNASRPTEHWGQEQTLHLAVAYSNPRRWQTRRELFNDFRRHIAGLPNIKLYVGELAYGDRPFEVTTASNPLDLQLRTRDELWSKENLNARVIQMFSPDWEYGGYIDGDCQLTRIDIGLETIQKLQHHSWCQMYSTYTDLDANHHPLRVMRSIAYRFELGELPSPELANACHYGYYGRGKRGRGVGTTGLAWAFRREAYDACGGLLDCCILGSGDWNMAFGLMGEPDVHPQAAELEKCNPSYAHAIKVWQARAQRAVRRNVGAVNCHAIHYFHGSKNNRGYGTRWQILRDHQFDPYTDIYKDHNGIWQLTPDKPGLRDAIRRYFSSRCEDDVSLKPGDNLLFNE